MKICIFDLEEWERSEFDHLGEQHDLQLIDQPLTPANASQYADAEIISTFIYSRFNAEAIEAMKELRLIATRSTGFDHIPLDVCRDRGVTVCNVPEYGSTTVAEHVFALLLAISHKLEQAFDRTRKGDFSPKGLQGFDLEGKTIGVLGTGSIGREVVRIALGFRMNVLAYDLQPDSDYAESAGFEYVDLDTLLANSDVLTLHVPANDKTHHLIGREQFDKMKRGAVLINTSRGDVVETKSLVRALADERLSAAGLDVLPEEPVIREEAEVLRSVYEESHNLSTLLADHILVHMRNVLVTPHSAFNTREAVQRILQTTAENIEAYIQGRPQNVVS